MKFSDRLAVDRTAMAADRTLMAWVRTAVSLIGFGFTIYKFLQYTAERGAHPIRPQGPRNLGLLLIVLGTVPLAMAMVQHWQTMRRLGRTQAGIVSSASFLVAVGIVALGLLLVLTVLLRIDLF